MIQLAVLPVVATSSNDCSFQFCLLKPLKVFAQLPRFPMPRFPMSPFLCMIDERAVSSSWLQESTQEPSCTLQHHFSAPADQQGFVLFSQQETALSAVTQSSLFQKEREQPLCSQLHGTREVGLWLPISHPSSQSWHALCLNSVMHIYEYVYFFA